MKSFLVFCALIASSILFSQSATVEGKIIGDQTILSLGQLKVFNADSTLLKGALIDSSDFKLNFNTKGATQFYLQIQVPEYSLKTVNFTLENGQANVGIITLEKNITLNEVSVVYKKPSFKRTMDGVTVNVEGTELQTLTNLFEVLKASPQLTSSDDESIEIIGKGSPLIMIDRQAITSNDELKAVPAAQIERIEIITHPSAKYKAQGSGGGVIEVFTKNFHLEGYNFTIRSQAGVNSQLKPTYGGHLGLSLKKKKFSLNAYLGANYEARISYNDTEGESTDDTQRSMIASNVGDGYHVWQYYNVKSAYTINTKQKLSVGLNGYGSNGGSIYDSETAYYVNGLPTTNSTSLSDNRYTWLNNSAFANYQFETDTNNSVLEVNLNYVNKVSTSNNQSFDNFTNYVDSSSADFNIKNVSRDIPNIGELRINYDHNFDTTQWKLSFGGSISTLFNGKKFNQFGYENNDWVLNESQSNSYDYSEYIGALFAEVSKKWKKIGFRAGLRGEYTRLDGYSHSLNQQFMDSSYILPFPSLSLLLEPNKNTGITFFYNSGIDRPQFSNFDPFIRQEDSLSIQYGNPYLLPAIEHSVGVDVNLFYAYNFSFSYNQVDRPISEFSFIQPGSFTRETTPWNADMEQRFSASLSLPFKTSWVQGWNSIWADYTKYTFTPIFNREPLYNLTFGAYSYLTFTLPKDWTITNRVHLNKWGGATTVNSTFVNWGLRVTKKYKGNNLQFYLDVGNIIPPKNKYSEFAGNYFYTGVSQWAFTSFKLGFFYKFGRLKANNQIEESSSGQSDRL
ncbi:MAG: outer membrane beta-barrel protein [Putridiphycobacter sp.]